MRFQLVAKSTILHDRKWPYTALCCTNYASFGAHCGNWKEDKPILAPERNVRPKILLSDGVRFMRIFVEIPWW